ncbi:MexE family multidrug efflux RND transporter periplasmic adaptor subunit [Vibrio sagamiensis NBRC 104589]|uniref:MexE family multidrug efflux RND transporter periplasmic adaptor subunit n=2 Tax=Vibrio sagamiensis TaxID=512650 RepID=A0A511Q9T0_9VIBR|nr:MexE family multidrug efflux RND transporter periplasmic adaptor subunit [Vibrio sagamiensis NBRC 104589]
MLLSACDDSQQTQEQAGQAQAVPVESMLINVQNMDISEPYSGRTVAYRIAEVRPQVDGIITKRLFEEGADVKEGQVLYQIESSSYQAKLDKAKGDLQYAKEQLRLNKRLAQRYKALHASRAISKEKYDEADSNYRLSLANVEINKSLVKSAQINLDHTQIKAPISGRIGKSFFSEGALVTNAQSNYLASIQQLSPLYVEFPMTSQEALSLRSNVSEKSSAQDSVKLMLDNGVEIESPAKLQFADMSVNKNTDTVTVRLEIPNSQASLLPNMYLRAEIKTKADVDGVLVPQKALKHNPKGEASVMVINAENKVEVRPVTTKQMIGNQWLITKGLTDGDQVITVGLQKIRPGALVDATNVNDPQTNK